MQKKSNHIRIIVQKSAFRGKSAPERYFDSIKLDSAYFLRFQLITFAIDLEKSIQIVIQIGHIKCFAVLGVTDIF